MNLRVRGLKVLCIVSLATLLVKAQGPAQPGNTEWRHWGGDARTTHYAPLDQINAANVSELEIAWRWPTSSLGGRADSNWEVTPLMVDGVLYFTAGQQRYAVAANGATGETLWTYVLDEGARGTRAVRTNNRGLSYWSDGGKDARVILITPGYHMVALDAKTGKPIPSFGKDGIVDLTVGLDRDVVQPNEIGSSSPAMIVGNVAVVGAALLSGTTPRSKKNVPGHVRGYDVRTGERLWTFRTIPHPGEFGYETWEDGSWEYTGNTAVWAPISADEELGYVYLPVETPTGDYYGGHRPGNNLFNERSNDNLTIAEVEDALLTGSILEEYPDTGRGESCLIVGFAGATPVHVVCGWSGPDKRAVVLITVYKPGPPKFSDPWTRGTK